MATVSGRATITMSVEFEDLECSSTDDAESQIIQQVREAFKMEPLDIVYGSIQASDLELDATEYEVMITITAKATDMDAIRHALDTHISKASICTDDVEFVAGSVEISIEEA